MDIIVQKYGGSSVADSQRIRAVADRIIKTKEQGNKVAVVVSAMGKSTDNLIKQAKEINPNPPEREMDMLLSTGEQISIALLAMAIKARGYDVVSLTGSQAGIHTDDFYNKARIVSINSERMKAEFDDDKIVIVAGFQGINNKNDITTLGRGGSDTTAVALCAALQGKKCEIYTDVDGVYTEDPRFVKNVKKINEITYDEMLTLASQGAKVLHPRCVELAKIYNIDLEVRSSFNYNMGTIVKEKTNMEKEIVVTAIAHNLNMVKLSIYGIPDVPGIASKIFGALAKNKVNVSLISQSSGENGTNTISFITSESDRDKAGKVLEATLIELDGKKISALDNLAIVTVVGAGMITNPGVASELFSVMGENNINIEMISSSEISISIAIHQEDCQRAVDILAKQFNLVEFDN
ncbi:aspartate kinase [Criibacterium bergeronii]|uniref:Aspartokinase n=1 Tax=Criibacterium bergeronii TaxID=1871336 RepID=A0A371ILN9_9FIRM|nr:aspartate kinase [Criibacterium bergeronii]MBS6062786.1 aspartate kinase [Peptostreptococcaceae bacterium]RDY21366.1 aspartate kinase [Criibacterium bergeronii]TRW27740.1 aspartate kinase [Criibacterium bergeronii]